MKYLFFIMLISIGCRDSWRPKPEKSEETKTDSTFLVDSSSSRFSLVVLNKKRYFFTGELSHSSVLEEIADPKVLDSLINEAKTVNDYLRVYAMPDEPFGEFDELNKELKKQNLTRVHLMVDDRLKNLRIKK